MFYKKSQAMGAGHQLRFLHVQNMGFISIMWL